MNRIETTHLTREQTKGIGVPSVHLYRVVCDTAGCSVMTPGSYGDSQQDDFAKERARGAALSAGWQIGPYSDGKSDHCPEHAKLGTSSGGLSHAPGADGCPVDGSSR